MTTLRDWMFAAGLWSRVRTVRSRHVQRVRKAHFGELVQLDGSFHDWFEGRGPYASRRSCVMSLVDDATGVRLLHFGAEETTWAAADVLQAWIARSGVPRALYTDWKGVYLRPATTVEHGQGTAPHTQFGRMCAKLGIQIIGASSPQAKGWVERGHGTHQDRLIKLLRVRGIDDDTAANAYCTTMYLPQHNGRFAVAAASTGVVSVVSIARDGAVTRCRWTSVSSSPQVVPPHVPHVPVPPRPTAEHPWRRVIAHEVALANARKARRAADTPETV